MPKNVEYFETGESQYSQAFNKEFIYAKNILNELKLNEIILNHGVKPLIVQLETSTQLYAKNINANLIYMFMRLKCWV